MKRFFSMVTACLLGATQAYAGGGDFTVSGKLGVGTISPSGKLDIVAGAARTGTQAASPSFYLTGTLTDGKNGPAAGNIEFRHDNGSQGIGFGYNTIYQAGSNINQDLNLQSRGNMPITLNAYPYSTGNVLIGTPSQSSTGRLFIKDDSSYSSEWNSAGLVITNNTATNPTLRIGTDKTAGVSYIQSMHLNQDWSAPLVLQGVGGNVGIGTTSPSYKLEVVGDIRAQNGWLRTTGNAGWYSDTYAGGWYMEDSTWVRSYNNKNVWVDAMLGSNGGLTVGYGGAAPPSGGAIIAGNVGIGTTSPASAKLQVAASGNTAIYASSDSIYAIVGYNSGLIGVYGIGSVGVMGRGTQYDFSSAGGEYGKNGVWSNGSDRNIKENFVNVESQTILDKISKLPMTQWNYISDVNKAKHIGPIAQDFYAIFGLGDDEKHVSTIDPAGIALVGVKALNEKIQDQQKQIEKQQKIINDHERELAEIRSLLAKLGKQ